MPPERKSAAKKLRPLVHPSGSEALETPPTKKRRLERIVELPKEERAESSQKAMSSVVQPLRAEIPKLPLLSFPDEVISVMFTHLKASDTRGAFGRPHNAFALARTNTRLLRLFRRHLSRITPDTSYDFVPPTLRATHFMSVVRLAGPIIQELHIPHSSVKILAGLQYLCPRLKKLTIGERLDPYDDYFLEGIELNEDVIQKLDSLCIIRPSLKALNSLVRTPKELTLTKVCSTYISGIIRVLSDPPEKLFLQLREMEPNVTSAFMRCLHEACVKMVEITLIVPTYGETQDALFLEEALTILKSHGQKRESKCVKMVLEGPFMELLNDVQPDSYLEVTRGHETFVKDRQIYAKRLPLWDGYLGQDVSRLKEVYVPKRFNMEWRRILSEVHLSCAEVELWETAHSLDLTVDVLKGPLWKSLDIPQDLSFYIRPDWHAYKNVKEICLKAPWRHLNLEDDLISFLYSLAHLVDHSPVRILGMEVYSSVYLENSLDRVNPALMHLARALDKFEEDGGTADGIRAWISDGVNVTDIFKDS